MKMVTRHFELDTGPDTQLIDITERVADIVGSSGIRDGNASVFVKGSTASISTIEYEPNLVKDFKEMLERIAPSDKEYHHGMTWGDDNGRSHVRATLMGPSISVPVVGGSLELGTWQQIVLIDFDVPARRRKVFVTLYGK